MIILEHDKPMIFGKNREKGLIMKDNRLNVVQIGEEGITESDILVHDAHTEFAGIHLMLANMEYPRFPVALGVIRAYESPASYDEKVENQIANVQSTSKIKSVQELFLSGQVWEV
ncbi:MAG: hypothetical protein R6V75_12365 [Bacteroidales bacterium]